MLMIDGTVGYIVKNHITRLLGTALYHASANIKLFLGGNIAFQKKIGQNKRSQEAFNHYLEEDVVLYPVKTKLDPCRKTLRISKSHGSYTELESKIVN
ncbi:unnamed protein product [Mytilus coruscus]|uniref:Uncharacterized protein n=1 Tax=Mytilus coruscus TaxID=42192 RepID=A0A6J8ASI6_MYTCO|nr:unnamed protein product [Mytilus coruscus]